jgi:vitamin B12 transporter
MKKEVKSIAVFLMALFSGTAASVSAQDSTRTQNGKEVVISAARSEKDPVDVPRSVTVLSGDSIRNSGATSLGELLSMQEGIYVMGSGQNPGQIQTMYTRGAGGNQAIIMIDGVRISDPSTNDNGVELNEISLADVDRIEIVRGSHSTIYGSSAIGGVINIITKKKADTCGIHADGQLTGGTFGPSTLAGNADVAVNYTDTSGFYVNIEGLVMRSNGLDATVDTVSNPVTYQQTHRDKDGFQKKDFLGRVGYDNGRLALYASYKLVMQQTDVDKGAYTDDDNYTVKFGRNLVGYGASYAFNDQLKLSVMGGYTTMLREAVDDSSLVDENGTTDHTYFSGKYSGGTLTNELQLNYSRKGLELVAGGGMFSEKMTGETYYFSNGPWGPYESSTNLDSLHINVATSYEFIHAGLSGALFSDKFSKYRLDLGMRHVDHELFGSTITYEIAPSVKLSDNALLYGSYSTGYNAPSLYQLYASESDYTSGITRGNKNLKPETSASLEIGFKQRINNQFSFGVSYFHTVVENSIDYVYLWDKNQEIDSLSYMDYRGDTYLNVGKQTNQGMEISVMAKLTDKISVIGNVSLVSGHYEYDPSAIDTAHTLGNHIQLYSNGLFLDKKSEVVGLVRRPGTGNFTVSYSPVKQLRLALSARYVGPRADIYYASNLGPFGALSTIPVGDYLLIDCSVRYQVTKSLSVQLLGKNMLDEKYAEIYGYTTRGRAIYLNVHYQF